MSIGTREIMPIARPLLVERVAAELAPHERVTLTPEARASDGHAGDPPRSDVRWYRPRGAAVLIQTTAGRARTGAGPAPHRHGAVEAYLRAMRLAA